jgi:predicted RNase H-like HicB family nuclease
MSYSYQISAVIEHDEHGYYAYCPNLKGCQSEGKSLAEAQANIQEAIALYLETLSLEERLQVLAKEITTFSLEVKVA